MNTKEIINKLGINAKKAAGKLTNTSSKSKNFALENLKKELDLNISEIIEVNNKDIENANLMNLSSAMIDRLTLTKDRILGIINLSLNFTKNFLCKKKFLFLLLLKFLNFFN